MNDIILINETSILYYNFCKEKNVDFFKIRIQQDTFRVENNFSKFK